MLSVVRVFLAVEALRLLPGPLVELSRMHLSSSRKEDLQTAITRYECVGGGMSVCMRISSDALQFALKDTLETGGCAPHLLL